MNSKKLIGSIVLGVLFVGLLGFLLVGVYINSSEKNSNINKFKTSPQVGNVVELQLPKDDKNQVMYSYFKITRIEADKIYGLPSNYQFNKTVGEGLIEKPDFFMKEEITYNKNTLLNLDITNILYYQND